MNNKQIMYDCDKGYILTEKGPVGATCVGGIWRPVELPECLPGIHPRLRWARRKRNIQNHQNRKIFGNFRNFKREMSKILRKNSVIDDPFPVQKMRTKRNVIHQRGGQRRIHRRPIRNHHVNHKWHLVAPAIMRFKRGVSRKRFPEIEYQFARPLRNEFRQQQQQQQQRNRFEEEQQRAYNKYYERIRQKHRNYINNLLRASHSQSVNDEEPLIFDNKENTYHDDDDYKTPAQDPFDEINAYASMPIPLPNINENRNVYAKKEIHDGIVNNTFVGRSHSNDQNQNVDGFKNRNHLPQKPSNEYIEFSPKQHQNNVTDILELLRSQIIRRRKRILYGVTGQEHGKFALSGSKEFHRVKRAPRAPKKNEEQVDEEGNGSDTENPRKARPKEPCEVRRCF